jgi:hypothetical protein
MTALRLAGFGVAALLLSHPTMALADDCDGPCPCVNSCTPGPVPLPPSVVVTGSGGALDVVSESFSDGVHQVNSQQGGQEDYITTGGRLGYQGTGSGGNRGTYGVTVSLAPTAMVDVGAINGIASATLLYRVDIHAQTQAAADALMLLLPTSGAIASINGSASLGVGGGLTSGSNTTIYTDQGAVITTGAGIFDYDNDYAAGALYGSTGSGLALGARADFQCDLTAPGANNRGTAGCGGHTFTLPLNFVQASAYDNGDPLDFIGSIELAAAANSYGTEPASALIDPTITLAQGLDSNLYTVTAGGGAVAGAPGAVPEPGAWAFLILGGAGLGAGLRRRRAALA